MTAIDKLIADAISYYVDERCSKMVEPVEGGKVGMRSKALDMIEERGIVKGMSQGRTAGMVENAIITVKNLIRDFDFSLEQACSAANISVEDYKKNTEK